jgi:hypothetical protein
VTAPVLLFWLFVTVAGLGLGAILMVLLWFWRVRWRSAWRGRSIEIVQGVFRDELWVDGKLVSSVSVGSVAGLFGGTRLTGTIRDAVHGDVPIVAVIDGNLGRASKYAVYIGGERVAGDHDDPQARAASVPVAPEPEDPRWAAARALLDSLDGSADPKVRDAAGRVGGGLRDALRHLAILRQTAPAHAALGGDVAEADGALNHEIERWLAALRELHLQATVKAGSADDILSKVRAEAEVDAAVRARARELARARSVRQPG